MMPSFSLHNTFRAARLATLVGVVALVAACDDPFASKASFTNADQPFAIAALTGADITAPAGLSLASRSVVRIDGVFDFDLAFDIDPAGKPVILPVARVGTPVGGTRLVGLQRTTTPYETLSEAPKSGYVFDSTMVFSLGAAIVVQSQASSCSFSFTPYTFAKVRIDSINATTRTLYGHTLINLNCGFRQLTPGLPTF